MIFIAILMLVTALLGMILFDLKILFGILMLLCAGGVLAYELVLKKTIQKEAVRYAAFGVLTAAFLLCALLPGSRLAVKGVADGEDPAAVAAGAAISEEDAGHLKAAREKVANEQYDDAEKELYTLSEEAKKTEEYYILYSDIRTGKQGFEETADPYYLGVLLEGVREHPDSLTLNYRAGMIAYTLNRYVTAESCLTRAFELAPPEDPYTPYALAAVYKQWGEDEYAYAFMTLAEKNGMLKTGETEGDELVKWYAEYKKELSQKEGSK